MRRWTASWPPGAASKANAWTRSNKPQETHRMTTPSTVGSVQASDLKLFRRGKVRDVFELPDDRLLIVSTDRLSAFDVVLPDLIPLKGKVLTQLSARWFEQTKDVV